MAKGNSVETKLARLHEVGLFEHITINDVRERKDGLAHAIDKNPGNDTYRAIQGVPKIVRSVLEESGNLIKVIKGKHAGVYEPRTHHEYAWLVDAGLEALGDARRMVAIRGVDWEEPLFVLATPVQVAAIANARIRDDFNPSQMPKQVEGNKALADLAAKLEGKLGFKVKVDGDKIAIDLAPNQVGAFIDRLYGARLERRPRKAKKK